MSVSHQHCAACGATLAPDQRYCVECGQRRGSARVPFAQQPLGGPSAPPSPPPQPRKPRMSVNTTLIAGIGTLMLAMGTGVLIGRAATSNARSQSPYQVLTVPSTAGVSGAAGSTATGTSATEASGAEASSGAGASSSKSSKSNKAAAKGSSAGATPKPKKSVVTVGSPGKGPGYEKGHFTGKFFGGGSESEEEEEE